MIAALTSSASAAPAPTLRVEAPGAHVARLWLTTSGQRKTSLALEAAPKARLPLAKAAFRVRGDQRGFDVLTQDGTPLLSRARIETGPGGNWTLTYQVAPGEKLLGLGQDNHNGGRLDRRGVIRELWAGQQINSGNVTAEYPVPLLLSTGRNGHAYGLFLDNVHRQRFDLAKTRADQVRCDVDGGEVDLYVIDGPRLRDVIERYTGLTGRPSLPPLWALGYWQSKCTYWDWHALDEAYHQLHIRGFPVDVMVIDADWPEVITDYVWAKRWKDGVEPADKIADYARKGVKIVMSQSGPMVRQDSPTYPSGWAAGAFANDGHGNPVECGYYGGKLLDFTHPRLNDWLWPQTRKLVEQGIAGWWLDLTEPEGEPPQTHYYAGRPAEIHNQYSQMCTRSFEGVQLAVHPEQRPFILTRCGSAGLQRHHAAVWTGDIHSDYATLRAHPPEMLNSGLSGFCWWTCDSGGFLVGDYKDDRFGAHARLYERWMQFSAFSPITRAHKAGGVPEPYGLGPTTEQGTRHYLQQRYRLLPYIYSYAWEASRTGLPLVRPMPLEYPDAPARGDQYLFGRELLVAPVLHEGQANRKVYFPPGQWIDWDYGYEYTGGRDWVMAAPQNRIPVAIRAGAIIPLAPDMQTTSEKPWDPITLEVYPHGKSSFTLYKDDGATFAYRKGKSTTTRIVCEESAGGVSSAGRRHLRLSIDESNKLFTPKRYVARFHLHQSPIGQVGSWDPTTRVLTVPVEAGAAKHHQIDIDLDGKLLAARVAPVLKADAIDPKGESLGSAGKPTPHFFPAPTLPALIKAVNFDNGGEGSAYHSLTGVPFHPLETDEGYVLSGLHANEWLRYTIDCRNGGYFDLTARIRGEGQFRLVAQDQTLVNVSAGKDPAFHNVTVPSIYLNPGELNMLLFVEAPGFALSTLDFRPAEHPPTLYPAISAQRSGVAEVAESRYIQSLGRVGSGLTFGLSQNGPATLRLRYRNGLTKPIALTLQVGDTPAVKLAMPPTGGQWAPFEVPVTLQPGGNRVILQGQESGWDSMQLESLEVLSRTN